MTWPLYFFNAATLAALSFVLYQLSTLGRYLMATQADVDKLTAQVEKIGVEVKTVHAVLVNELDDVKAQLAAAGAAEKVDLTGLAAAIQNVDDINPDAVDVPEDVPADDVPAEVPAEVPGEDVPVE